ncbi:kinase-like domain-containing protein [Cokeromyces recurvatus]|uniref:kinase-like domain-containing protein n=1 Tax=Cokeromyces recurvatus TaxID=90255 RepID=UPI00221EB571|nr:kinase-like domain-containing protein [Cokeromyces recurvatus]KAI7907960.1 kinase-like domain-containing protein [Cokeromyces recurvatus]
MVGLHFIGDYFISSTIGYGSTGQVKLGIHQISGTKVAIKIIPRRELDSSLKIKQAVERELAVLQLLNHPNLIELYQILQDERNIYFIMEYVPGGELYSILNEKPDRRLNEIEAREIFKQIADALIWCHAHHICHRDLKLENILLDEGKRNIKIADFGMAIMQPTTQLLKTSCGSPHYASPEIVRGIPYYGPAADVWSSGVILYVLIIGKLPFDDHHLGRLLTKIKVGRFRRIPNWVSPLAKDLLCRMLTVDPNKRLSFIDILSHPWMISSPSIYCNNILLSSTLWNDEKLKYPSISNSSDLHGPTRETLKVLWRDLNDNQIESALMKRSPNVQKLTYYLLQQTQRKKKKEESTYFTSDNKQKMVKQPPNTITADKSPTLQLLEPNIIHRHQSKSYLKHILIYPQEQHNRPIAIKALVNQKLNTIHTTCLHALSPHTIITTSSPNLLPQGLLSFMPHHNNLTTSLVTKLVRRHTAYLTSITTKLVNTCTSLFGSRKRKGVSKNYCEEKTISCIAESQNMAAGKLHYILSEHFQGYVNGYMYSNGKIIWYGKLDDSPYYNTNFICRIQKVEIEDDKALLYKIIFSVHNSNSSMIERIMYLLTLYENESIHSIRVNNWEKRIINE